MPQRSLPLHGYHKKRAGKIFILITALILFLLLSSCSAEDESVYFDMLTHGDKPRDMQERHRIFHYDGKSGYSVVYTFEDTKPLTAIEDHYLYYTPYKGKEGQPTALHRVDLITGEDIVYNEMEYHSAIWLEAYEGELYLLCKSLGSMDAYIYQITQQNTARCSDTALKMPMSFTFGDRCLFYISDDDSADSHSLMKVDLETLEISFISKEPGIEPTNFEYSDGRLYGHYVEYLKPVHDCYSISIHSGEKRLEEEDITGITVRDGWLYYTKRFSSGERGRYGIPNSRLYARNFKTGKTKDYGPIFIHGFYNYLEEHITFGKNGFVITKPNEYLGREGGWETLNLYYYYPYSGGEPVPLSLDEKTAAAT